MNEKRTRFRQFNELLLILLFVATLVVMSLQVFMRTFVGEALFWAEELSRYLFIFFVFGGAAIALDKGLMVSVDVLRKIVPQSWTKAMNAIGHLVTFCFFLITAIEGIKFFQMGRWQYSPGLGIEIRYVYLAIPIFGLQMCYYSLRKLIRTMQTDRVSAPIDR